MDQTTTKTGITAYKVDEQSNESDLIKGNLQSNPNRLERKFVPFEVKNIEEDDEFFIVEGYASTFGNIDRGDDVIERGAFTDSLKRVEPKLLWQHNPSEPIGKTDKAFEDNIGLFVRLRLPKADTFVSGRIIPQVKIGSVRDFSIGFSIDERPEFKTIDGKRVRSIKLATVWEISFVTIPMNSEANFTAFKSAVQFQDLPLAISDGEIDFDREWNSSDAIDRVRELTGSIESPTKMYKEAFLFYDRENEGNFSAYKLPIADVINGRLTAVPRAIFSASAAMRGSRGGVNIPDSDRETIINNLNRYFKKMDRESPFEKSFAHMFDTFNKIKDISSFLKDFGLSNKEANSMLSAVKRTLSDPIKEGVHSDHLKYFAKKLNEINKHVP